MRLSREAILIAVAAEQILGRDRDETFGRDPRVTRFLRYLRYKRRWRLPEMTLSGGPFDSWTISQLPWREFMRCIYRRRRQFDLRQTIAIEREFKRRDA